MSDYRRSIRSLEGSVSMVVASVSQTLGHLRYEDDSYHASRRYLGQALDLLNDAYDSARKATEHLPVEPDQDHAQALMDRTLKALR